MDFLPEKIDAYVAKMTAAESESLSHLNRETHLKVLSPRMLSGHVQGRFLSLISHMIQPKYVLEIGTYTGYSAMCFAEGLAPGGKVVTIDRNEELEEMLNEHVKSSQYSDQIELHFGNAADIIPTLPNEIDLVFIDADKPNYSLYFDLVIDKVRSGGFILADNVLWNGKVVEPISANDKSTVAIHGFNEKVHLDDRVENVLLPIRDGIMALRKK